MYSTVTNPVIPYVAPVPGPLQPGQLIRVQGIPNSSATCFSINLQNGSSVDRRNDVALHLSPVFSPPPRLVRNSIQNQQWGPEESHGSHFPFSPGQSFEIMILVESDHFKIAVNGQHFTEFRYRLPISSVSYLAIDGDVMINAIKYESTTGQTSPHSEVSKDGGIVRPLGFLSPDSQPGAPPPSGYDRPPSPYGPSSSPYGTPSCNMPGQNPYGQNPYGPPPVSAPYLQPTAVPPPPPPGYPSPSQPTYPTPGPPPAYPNQGVPSAYPSQHYPSQNYPSQHGAYPSQGYPSGNPYPAHPGPYPGTSVVYPGSGKDKGSSASSLVAPLAAGAAALAGSGLLSGKHGKYGKHHGPTSIIADGAAALLGGGTHGQQHHGTRSSPIPIGGALAGGAAALAGAYMLNKSPLGHMMKPKKMKKLYKHKHKLKGHWKHGGSSSSSSSSSDE